MIFKYISRRSLAIIVTLALTLTTVAACGNRSKIEQYEAYLVAEDYAGAAGINAALDDSEEDQATLERSLALHLLSLQAEVWSGTLTIDAYTQKLNAMASFELSSDDLLIGAAVDVLLAEEDAREMIAEARRVAKSNEWVAALDLMAQARPFSTATPELRQLYTTIRSSYKQDIVSRVESLEAQGALEAAENLLSEAGEALPNDNDLAVSLMRVKHLRFTQERTALLQNVSNLRSQDAWGPALDAIRMASSDVSQDVEVSALKEQIELQYEEPLLEKLEALEAENSLEEALVQVKLDLEVFPDSLRLQWKLRIYEAIAAADTVTAEPGGTAEGNEP